MDANNFDTEITRTSNANLHTAKVADKNEFYTQYEDIEKEMNAYFEYNKNVFRDKTVLCPCDDPEWSNFTKYFVASFNKLGLKKLISTSYAKVSGNDDVFDFEKSSSKYDANKHSTHGKVFTITKKDIKNVDFDDIQFEYLEGDGDFRSDEVCKLRDEADIIITNPPFSLFRDFIDWLYFANKQFIIIGNVNAVTYKEIFPLLRDNRLWLGVTIHSGDRKFYVPDNYPLEAAGCGIDKDGRRYIRVKGVRWYTNIEHGYRHEQMNLMTMADNIKFNRKAKKKFDFEYNGHNYPQYDNYDAIEVPTTDSIPSDYDGVMGVPITFLDRYCPEQFEILDINPHFFSIVEQGLSKPKQLTLNGVGAKKDPYARILIKHKKGC